MDFSNLTESELLSFVLSHQAEMAVQGISAFDLKRRLLNGEARFVTRPEGFTLIQLPRGKKQAHLWLLYVEPEARGRGVGSDMVRDFLSRHAGDQDLTVYCEGDQRETFFNRLGFAVERREGEVRCMVRRA